MQYSKSLITSAGTLLTGSALASLISLISLPFLTRIYTPEILGVGTIYLAIHSLLLILASGRYSLAISLPKRDKTARYIFWLVVILSCTVGIVSILLFIFFGDLIARTLSAPILTNWLPLLGITVPIAAMLDSVNYWLVRKNRYKTRATYAVVQVTILVLIQLLAGFLIGSTVDVYMLSLISGMAISMFVVVIANIHDLICRCHLSRFRKIAIYYRKLPQHLFTTALPNTVSVISLPLIISVMSGPSIAAIYSISAQLVGKPLNLISSAIWQVIYGQLGKDKKNHIENLSLIKIVYSSTTFLYSFPLLIIFAFPEMIQKFLGKNWISADEMMMIYIVMAYFQYSSNSISYFQIFKKYKAESTINIMLIIVRLLALTLAAYMNLDGFNTVLIFCIASALFYLAITSYWSLVLNNDLAFLKRGFTSFLVTLSYAFIVSNYVQDIIFKIILVFIYVLIFFHFSQSRLNQEI